MIYEILNDAGAVINRIVANEAFVKEEHPGKYRLVDLGLPPPTFNITKVALISRFTPQEYVGIVGATKTDVEVQAWYDLFQAATIVNLQDQRTIAGVESFVTKSLLTQPRATEILTTPAQPNEIPQ